MDCSPSGSSVHGILQAGILEQVAIPFSRGSSRPSDGTCLLSLLHWQAGSLPLVPLGAYPLPNTPSSWRFWGDQPRPDKRMTPCKLCGTSHTQGLGGAEDEPNHAARSAEFPISALCTHSCHGCSTWVTRCFYPISLPLSSTMPPKQSKKSGHVSFWLKTNKKVPPWLLITKRELQASEHSAELVQASPFPHCPGLLCFGSEGLQPAPQSILQFRPYGFSMLFPLLWKSFLRNHLIWDVLAETHPLPYAPTPLPSPT